MHGGDLTGADAAAGDTQWLSAHLFFRAGIYDAAADAVALEVVAPFFEECRGAGWAHGHFFIRYADELGPHLRVRVRVADSAAAAAAGALLAAVRDAAPGADLEPYGTSGVGEISHASGLRPSHRVVRLPEISALRWIRYEPELERYGGPVAIELAERVFEASSDVSLALLRGLDTSSRSARLGRALLAMLVTARAFLVERGRVASFAAQYGKGYLQTLAGQHAVATWKRAFAGGFERQGERLAAHVEAVWAGLEDGEPIPVVACFADALGACREELQQLCAGRQVVCGQPVADWDGWVSWVLPSYVHMTSNRLGVSIPEEVYLAHLVHWILTESGDAGGGEGAPNSGDSR